MNNGWWTEPQDKALVLECRQQVRDALAKAERQLKPGIVHLFTDVYDILIRKAKINYIYKHYWFYEDTIPASLQEQKTELELHLRKHPDEYPIDLHSKSL